MVRAVASHRPQEAPSSAMADNVTILSYWTTESISFGYNYINVTRHSSRNAPINDKLLCPAGSKAYKNKQQHQSIYSNIPNHLWTYLDIPDHNQYTQTNPSILKQNTHTIPNIAQPYPFLLILYVWYTKKPAVKKWLQFELICAVYLEYIETSHFVRPYPILLNLYVQYT